MIMTSRPAQEPSALGENKRQKTDLLEGGEDPDYSVEKHLSVLNLSRSTSELGPGREGASSRDSLEPTCSNKIEKKNMPKTVFSKTGGRDKKKYSKMENGDDNEEEDWFWKQKGRPGEFEIGESFFLRQPFTAEEFENVVPAIKTQVQKPVELLEKKGFKPYRDWYTKKAKDDAVAKRERKRMEQALIEAKIDGAPRQYQQRLFEIACKQNTIVHLGTGAGKTLVGLMCIRHFAYSFRHGKQTLFLVPSVALAIQQSTVLRANLPYSVQVACYATTTTSRARLALQDCNIIVATHGAIHDLFMHYGDLFSMDRFNLVVVDECHNAIGSHAYATLMKRFYHTLAAGKRPRVVGLTASPLVKAKPTHSEENLAEMLLSLEQILDAKVVSNGSAGTESETESEDGIDLMKKAAEERDVLYRSDFPVAPYPFTGKLPLHYSRKKEVQQLSQLYEDLGPLVVSIYCQTLTREVSRNTFERESSADFKKLLNHFHSISVFCDRLCQDCPSGGRSDKLLELEALLEDQIEDNGGPETVGLVFVERRITALALNDYFRFRNKHIKRDNWVRASEVKQRQPKLRCGLPVPDRSVAHTSPGTPPKRPLFVSPSSTPEATSMVSDGQFEDAEDDLDVEYKPPSGALERFKDTGGAFADAEENGTDVFKDTGGAFADAEENGTDVFERYFQGVRENDSCVGVQGCATVGTPDLMSEPSSGAQVIDTESSSEEGCNHTVTRMRNESIRCQALVRNSTQIFKSLNMSRKSNVEDDEEARKSWLHQEYKIREVLSGMRRGDINVLIATSVVEEGVDVQACSFVIVFDSLKSTKGYIQMKGRARQKDAKFYVFQNVREVPKSALSLKSAREIESRVSRFIASRANISSFATPQLNNGNSQPPIAEVDDDEIRAVEMGVYETKEKHGTVDLYSGKSLVNRYVLSLPIDPIARSSKASFLAHLPTYSENQLYLPSHLPAAIRTISLPERYRHLGTKEKQKIMAMMACVRLHKQSLLNERLLPLTRSDLQLKMLELVTQEPRHIPVRKLPSSTLRKLIVYPFRQESAKIDEMHRTLRSKGHSLAIISTQSLDEVPPMRVAHGLFGTVNCMLGQPFIVKCTEEEFQVIMCFFKLMMDCRWRRRTKNVFFRPKASGDFTHLIPPYFVGCLSPSGELDWVQMTKLVAESRRSTSERIKAVQSSSDSRGLPQPRLYSPLYDTHFTYISYGPSGHTCAAEFPTEKEYDGVVTFQDYFTKCRGVKVAEDCPLFDAQRLWVLPFNKASADLEHGETSTAEKNVNNVHSKRYDVCEELRSLLLPKQLCIEVRMADPNFLLLCTHLPQFLHHIQPYVTAKSFIEHTKEHMPRLGGYLSDLPLQKVSAALTAKSCSEEHSYEKLEWFGDAVLKLVQTDCLLDAKDLSQWIEFLHEGDLSTLRSIMGSNERLELACKNLKIDDFILTSPLGRGHWTPASLELYMASNPGVDDGKGDVIEEVVSGKTCADVIESLLGLIFMSNGYEAAAAVADELQVTLPRGNGEPNLQPDQEIPPKAQLLTAATSFTGQTVFKRHDLVEEAFTHPTAMHPLTPSYQRLEWIGDAVLCIAVREWIFNTFPDADLGQMVAMEASLVANETLAYLSIKHGLLKNLNHCDQSLPSRIEKFEWSTQELGRGLWGTDPPKVAADIVESLIGAVYMDSGFMNGVKSVMHILRPMLKVLEQIYEKDSHFIMMHPKKAMQEIGGSLLIMKVAREEDFALKYPNTPVWLGKRWGRASPDGNRYIGYVQCLNFIVVAVADTSSEVGGNRACAFAVSMLRDDPDLLDRMLQSRTMVESSSSRQANVLEGQNSSGQDGDDSREDEKMEEGKNNGVDESTRKHARSVADDIEGGDIVVDSVVHSMVQNVLEE